MAENHYLGIFKQIKVRPSEKDFKPEQYHQFLDGFKTYLEGFNWDAVKQKCIEDSDKKELQFLLLSADLSGIQNTVYTISSKGALKSLRARSFMLELLCEHLCYELITTGIGDYKAFNKHVLFSGGGGLCVILPNNQKNRENVETLKTVINKWAFEEFSGKLYVAMAALELAQKELEKEEFRATRDTLAKAIEKDKKHKFKNELSDLFSCTFLTKSEPEQRTSKEECQICHRDNIKISKESPFYSIEDLRNPIIKTEDLTIKSESETVLHALCAQLFNLGSGLTKLTQGSKIYRSDLRPKGNAFIDFPKLNKERAYYFLNDGNPFDFHWVVNTVDKEAPTFLYAYYTKIRKDIPDSKKDRKENEPEELMDPDSNASFVELAKMARGADYIGCLRMDVDNMGRIFSNIITLENSALLSRLLNLFFKVYLNKICLGDIADGCLDVTGKDYKNNHGRNVSIIYAGGDDLFISGAWDETAELCYDIQVCFARYSGLGITGGLTLHKPDYPLYQMATVSGEAEHAAKSFINKPNEKETTKNKIALFYTPLLKQTNDDLNTFSEKSIREGKQVHWDKVHYALDWTNKLPLEIVKHFVALGMIKEDRLQLEVSHALVYKLFSLAEVWWQRDTMYIPEFIYIMSRFKKSKDIEYRTKIENLEKKIFQFPVKGDSQKHVPIRSMRIPLTWVDLLLRGGTEK